MKLVGYQLWRFFSDSRRMLFVVALLALNLVLFRSYTGAQNRYYIDPVSGEATVTELVPGIMDEEQRTDESLNVWDYLS